MVVMAVGVADNQRTMPLLLAKINAIPIRAMKEMPKQMLSGKVKMVRLIGLLRFEGTALSLRVRCKMLLLPCMPKGLAISFF